MDQKEEALDKRTATMEAQGGGPQKARGAR